jgi:hypothetical protein
MGSSMSAFLETKFLMLSGIFPDGASIFGIRVIGYTPLDTPTLTGVPIGPTFTVFLVGMLLMPPLDELTLPLDEEA